MTLFKFGELLDLGGGSHVQATDSVLMDPVIQERMADDSEILSKFRKTAIELKQIAPRAKDFLYFSAIMMHAAEAALLDEKGNLKKDASGQDVAVRWERRGDSLRWVCSDQNVRPYKNSNNDIFPEEELIKAHKKWVGRPLCLDHKSSSVDMIRGVIVDTYYDRTHKRVVALCALDKINYPDLARKVSTGYATSVSMGTAVGRAICSDCGNVARIESDFCDHMRKKSCYGEINIDLNPIELSIVVNGADPAAKIRHIVAAANCIASYVDMKQEQFQKLAEDETRDIELANEVEQGLGVLQSKILEMQDKIKQLKENEEAEQARSESAPDPVTAGVTEDLAAENALNVVLGRLEELDSKFNKLSKLYEETEMTKKNAYFQGGGGVNEPSPGQVKYEKEDEDSIRDKEDKQMGGQMETGPVDGMHPGYDSFGESEEARKKRLLRASDEQKERSLRREAALARAKQTLARSKEGYHLGGGGVNEPTPGKTKYNKEDSDSIRDKEDKQMVGAPPFPGVGKIDGLYGDDEKEKKVLLRAKLQAKFIKAAKPDGSLDKGESRWQVYADDKLILTATVNEITGNKSESEALFESINSKPFGRELLTKIRSEGFERAASFYKGGLYKGGQVPSAGPAAPMPAAPVGDAPGGDPFGGVGGGEEMPVDKGDSGDPKEVIATSINEMQNRLADLAQAWDSLQNSPSNELKDFDQLAGGEAPQMAAASQSIQYKVAMQKKVASALKIGIKQLAAELTDHIEELKLAEMLTSDVELMKEASTERKANIKAMIDDAVADSKKTLANAYRFMGSFCKYARATEMLVSEAQKEIEMRKLAQVLPGIGESSPQLEQDLKALRPMPPGAGKPAPKKPAPVAAKPAPAAPSGGESYTENLGLMSSPDRMKALNRGVLKDRQPQAATGITTSDPAGFGSKIPGSPSDLSVSHHSGVAGAKADDGKEEDREREGEEVKDENDATVTKSDGTKIEMNAEEAKEVLASQFDLTTKEGRAAYRTKLAEKGMQYSDMIGKAHPQGGFTTELDVKPTGDLAKVETIVETHEKMMDVALAPPKVRKMAEEIQRFVTAGKINPETDFDTLIAQGLDSDAVKYWKQFYGSAKDGGSEFAAALVKDYDTKKRAEEQNAYKVRVKRAYDLAYEMAEKELIGKDASSINTQVNEILEWSDDNFNSLKKLVARQAVVKKASAMPQVGMIGGGDVLLPAPEAEPSDLRAALESAFANKKY